MEEAGNVTIFSPLNKAFDELDTPIEDVPLPTIKRWILKHFVKDFLFKRDMVNGPVSITFNFKFFSPIIQILTFEKQNLEKFKTI